MVHSNVIRDDPMAEFGLIWRGLSQRICIVLAVGVCLAGLSVRAGEADEPALSAPAAPGEVARLIGELSDPSYDRRMFATRRLVAIGREALAPLSEAARGSDLETALRAQRIVRILESILFAGCELTIEFSKPRIRWDEPVDLRVTIENKSRFTATVPFEFEANESGERPSDAMQVALMLDVGEWLLFLRPDGTPPQMRVDDIAADPDVLDVVQERLGTGPTSELAAGRKVTIVAPSFNRGWARFPLLEAGEYTAVFEYSPQWSDEALAGSQVGRLRSNTARLSVVEAAPTAVSRSETFAEVVLIREGSPRQAEGKTPQPEGGTLVARLTNRHDLPLVINRNFGPAPPFAQGQWVYDHGEKSIELALGKPVGLGWEDFRSEELIEVASGQSIELDRIALSQLRSSLVSRGADVKDGSWMLRFSYVNLCGRGWQAREAALLSTPVIAQEKPASPPGAARTNPASPDADIPKVLRDPLPRRLIVLHRTSQTLAGSELE